MRTLRPSQRVTFDSGLGHRLSGIVDLPLEDPKAFAVFTHCFTCTKDLKLIVRISRGLAEHGFGILRYDSTGLGNSDGEFSQSNFTSNQSDLRAAVQWMSEHFSSPLFLIGHSFGGATSLSIAQELPSVLAVASLAAPSDTAHLASHLERMNPEISRQGSGEVVIGGTRHLVSRQMLDDFRSFDLPASLRQLSKPVLLFHSPEDETLGFEHAQRLYQLLTSRKTDDPAPCATSLICLDGADHLLTRNPSDLSMIVRFLAAWFDHYLRANQTERLNR